MLVAGITLTYSNPSVSRQQRGTLSDISGAHTKSARTRRGRRVTRTTAAVQKRQRLQHKSETMVQSGICTKMTSNPSAPQIHQPPNLLFSEQTDSSGSSLFPLQQLQSPDISPLVYSVAFQFYRTTARPSLPHTHRGLCADSNNTHTQCGPVRVWHLKIRPEECFLWRLRAAAF